MTIGTFARQAFIAVALTACAALPARAAELTVSAAISLSNAFQEMKPLFEKANPGVTLLTNFGASGALLKQMAEGAPVDVFASADQETMDQAAQKNLIGTSTRKDFAANTLVMIVPADSRLAIKAPVDLAASGVERIAVGNPDSVPAGRYARQSLGGLYDQLSPKFVLAANVRQVLDYVSRGEVAAGFVYRTDALVAGDKVKIAAELGGHSPITYPAAALAASPHKAEAARFLAFLVSAEGQAILAKYGFSKP